jgi:hypothetical protein
MVSSSNKLVAICSLCIALCAGCQQEAEKPAPSTMALPPPATVLPPAGSLPADDEANRALAGMNTAGAPATGVPGTAGAPQTSGAQQPPTAQQPPPYPGLPTGPDLPIDPATQLTRFVPTDTRSAIQALHATPISGGTLLITSDGATAVASDPERDRVSIVNLTTSVLASPGLLANVALQAGDEPGRMVQDAAGNVHVVLRRAGAVATIALSTQAVVARRSVCASPRGIAYDAGTQMLKIACVGGELIDLPAASGEVASRVKVDSDLRDVVQTTSGSFVSRLKSAELLHLDAHGAMLASSRPPVPTMLFPETDGSEIVDTLEPVGARRTIASQNGGFVMLHQGARNGDIEVQSDNANAGGSPYGGTGSCSGVVTTEVTGFDASGKPTGTVEFGGVLAVDISESAKTSEFAVAFAGAADPLQPLAQLGGASLPTAPTDPAGNPAALEVATVMQFDRATLDMPQTLENPACIGPIGVVTLPAPATAVAYAGDRLVVQTREPAALFIVDSALNNQGTARVQIDLGGPSMLDTGHEIFHRDAGAGVACASCHLEGGDDGHVWHFVDQGARRTQSMFVGLQGTAPFHWVGDMNDLGTLMENVFVGRMGGVHQNAARLGGLEQWLYAIKEPPALRAASDPAAARGRKLFEGDAKCSTCHSGAKFTDNKTVDVGTGLALQVPSLVGVAYRGPWIHTGCAATLRDRFDPACGGDKHGETAQLSSAQIDDLVAYLETL